MKTAGAIRRARLCALSLAILLSVVALPVTAEVVVVVAANSPIKQLSDNEIADVFLGKLTRLPDGTSVVPLDQAEGSATRAGFYLKFTGKSPAQLKAFWSKAIFTGRGRPPRALTSDAEIIRALHENPGAIGYVERASVGASARILR
ncbi:MAG: phosphate ABC transporter substrate-binding protein [Pseudomonadota bacterium]